MKRQFNSKLILISCSLFAILLVSYSNHFYNTFHFDDSHTVESNPYIRSLDNCVKFFYSPEMFSSLPSHRGLRPLVSVSLAIDYWLGNGLNPFYFQLSTFIWYCLMVVLLFYVYKKMIGQAVQNEWTPFAALLITGWYALHTANAETINYIISRSDVLSTFFIMLSFAIFVYAPKIRKYYIYIIPAAIGLFAKETLLTLVIILFFYINFFEKNLSVSDHFKTKNLGNVFKTILSLLPLFICLAGIYYIEFKISSTNGPISTKDMANPFGYYVLTQSYVWVRYFIEFFIPANLTADSDWTIIRNIFDERIIIGLVFVSGLVYVIFKTSHKKETKPISFGLMWFAVSLLPTSLVPLAEVTNDHRMFYASIGLALAAGHTIYLFFLGLKEKSANIRDLKIFIFVLAIHIIGLNAYGVFQRNKVWKTEESLWLDVTQKSPANGRGLMNYGLTQMGKGNYAEADIYFTKAQIYTPYYESLFINIAILKAAMGKDEEADMNFKKAIEYSHKSSHNPYYFYARYLTTKGKYAEAEPLILEGITINPYSDELLLLLATVYNETQQWDKLAETSNKILQIDPNSVAGKQYLKAGQDKKMLIVGNVKKAPTAQDYINQSLVYYNNKESQKCIDACKEALKLDPKSADAYNNIGVAYNQMSQWQNAIDALTKALELRPDFQLAKNNLNWAKSELKKINH